MQKSAQKIVTVCMNVCKDESVLIITDTNKVKIGRAIFEAASAISANTAMLMMKPTTRHADEPQDIIAKKMLDTDVIIAPTTYSLTHTMARQGPPISKVFLIRAIHPHQIASPVL